MEEIRIEKICGNCNYLLELNKNEIVTKTITKNNKIIYLQYFICPGCGRFYFVQADDEETLSLLNDVKRMFIKLCISRRNGKRKNTPRSLNNKYKNANAKLSMLRKNLIENCQNHHFEIDGKDVLVKFINL